MAEEIIQGNSSKKQMRKKVLIILGIVLLLLVIAGGASLGARWWLQQREYEQQAEPDAIADTTTEAQNQVLEGNFDQAHETIDNALDNPRLADKAKFNLYMQQGAAHESQQNYDAAMASYRKAEALQENLGVIYSIANLAQIMGDNDLAVTYYEKAIPLIPEDDPLRDQRKRDFENWVSILEGRGPVHE